MKDSKNNSNKRKKKSNNRDKYIKDIYGIIIIAFGLLSLLSLFSTKMGIIGSFLAGTSFSFMGFGAYFFPLLVIFSGLIFILNRFELKEKRVLIASLLIFLSFLIFLDGMNPIDYKFLDRIKNSISLSKVSKGGGILGSFFGFFLYKLFGSVGTYIVLSFVIVINLLIISNKNLNEIFSKTTIPKIKVLKKNNKPNISTPTSVNQIKEDVNIIEHNKNLKISPKETSIQHEKENLQDEIKLNINKKSDSYVAPSLSLLKSPVIERDIDDEKEILNNARIIEETMSNFGIEAKVIEINVGPTITCYELQPAPGVKLSKIVSLSDNIALSLASSDIRIEAPIPGKSAVGIEVPNKVKKGVLLKEIILSKEYQEIDSNLPLALGKDVSGNVVVSSIDKMPHLLIAGATGSGKSVCINTIITSIIFKSSPEDVKLLLIDPKVVELSIYNGIPHLLIPVVTDPKKAASALSWAVDEMEKRYKLFAENSVRDINAYNSKMKTKEDQLAKIVIIIDELADLMMVAAQEIEDYICRLAQMARAAGIHLIVATQRPSVDVITGTIKANIPSRISFAVSSQADSRTILDMAGAEKLLGYGDMLFFPSHYPKPVRIQGAFISDQEVEAIVKSISVKDDNQYDVNIIEKIESPKELLYDDGDELLPEAISLVVEEGQASISLLQRRFKIGYARAARLIDQMEERGIVGGYEGSKPRKVLITPEELESLSRSDDVEYK